MKRVYVLALLAGMMFVPANGQVLSGGELGRVMAGPTAEFFVRNGMAPFDFAVNNGGDSLGRSIVHNTTTGAVIGAGIGAAFGSTKSALIGAGIGGGTAGVATWLLGRRHGDRGQKPLDCSKKKNRDACQAFAAEQAARETIANTRLTIHNRTGFQVEVTDCGDPAGTLERGESKKAIEAKCGYRAMMVVPDQNIPGRTRRVQADHRLTHDADGWIFTAPKGGRL